MSDSNGGGTLARRTCCYACGKAVSMQELWDVDTLLETSPRLERIADHFAHCVAGPEFFHDNGAFNHLDVVNVCKDCFDDIDRIAGEADEP